MNAKIFDIHDDITTIKEELETNGCVVIKNVLSKEVVNMTKQYIYDWLNENGVDVNDSSTWQFFSKDYFYMSHSIHGMMVDGPNMFIKPVIYAKMQSSLIEFMSRFYNLSSRELAIEHAGLFFRFPPEIHRVKNEPYRGFRHPKDEWFHTDLGCLQAGKDFRTTIVIEDCNYDSDHTFTFLSKSHLYHDEFVSQNKQIEQGLYQLNQNEVEWFQAKGCTRARACATAGSLIMWHPKTIHATEYPSIGRKHIRPRIIIYGSLIPRQSCNHTERQENLKKYLKSSLLSLFSRDKIRMLTYV